MAIAGIRATSVPRFFARRPRPPLDRHVELLWTSEGRSAPHLEMVLPFGKGQLLVNLADDGVQWVRRLDDRVRLPGPVLQGPMTRPLLVDPSDQRLLVGATLHPWGLAALGGASALELRDQVVELSAVTSVAIGGHRDDLLLAPTPGARVDRWERLLIALTAATGAEGAPMVQAAARRLEADGSLRIRSLADELGIGQRSLSDRFIATVGMRPKLWQRVRRFRRSLGLLEAGAVVTEIAHGLGYADQAHFNHEFRRFSGHAPGGYLRRTRPYSGHLALG